MVNIIFPDEKLLVIQQSHNAKNDTTYVLSIQGVDKGVKVDAKYYQTEILEQKLLVNAPRYSQMRTGSFSRTQCQHTWWSWPKSSVRPVTLDYSVLKTGFLTRSHPIGILYSGPVGRRFNVKSHCINESLKRKLVMKWDNLSMNIIRAMIHSRHSIWHLLCSPRAAFSNNFWSCT